MDLKIYFLIKFLMNILKLVFGGRSNLFGLRLNIGFGGWGGGGIFCKIN